MALRVLSIAVASGRLGYVFFNGDKLMDWRMVERATASPLDTAEQAQTWINRLQPDVVITENPITTTKGQRSKTLMEAVARVAERNHLLDVTVARERSHKNKYQEAAGLVEKYPELRPWLPAQRRCWENEPRQTVLFEALAYAVQVKRGSATELARAVDR